MPMKIAEETKTEITYRWLKKEEWGRITDIFRRHGVDPPSHDVSLVAVGEADGKIVSILPLQLVLHAEPLWIDEAYRGKVNWQRMVRMADGAVAPMTREYFVFANDPKIARMCEIVEMERLSWTVFRRRL